MSENQAKVPFVSPAWVDIARGMLEELVSEHGEEGKIAVFARRLLKLRKNLPMPTALLPGISI